MLKQFTDWLFGLVQNAFTALAELLTDVVLGIVEAIGNAVVALLSLIPVPDFMQGGIGGYLAQLGGDTLWLLGQLGIAQALGIIGAGYTFRFARKLVTFFQW